PRGIHAPGHSFGIIQTMLLALPNFGLERMGRNNSSGYAGMALLGALRAQNPKPKTQNPKPKKFFRPQAAKNDSGCCGFSRPIRASPQVKKSGSHARRDAGQGSWYRMYLTIRGRWRFFFSKDQLGRGPERIVRRSFSLHWGAGAEPRIRPPTAACPATAGSISRHAVTAKPARLGWQPLQQKSTCLC